MKPYVTFCFDVFPWLKYWLSDYMWHKVYFASSKEKGMIMLTELRHLYSDLSRHIKASKQDLLLKIIITSK